MPSGFGGSGQQPSGRGLVTNTIALAAGETYQLPTGGAFGAKPGRYTSLQLFDPILQAWRNPGGGDTAATTDYVNQDGINWRLANQTGCAVGALITNAGSGYTSAPAVTASAGSSQWRAIVGGAISTTVTVSNGGSGYTYPPIVLISAPLQGGIQATATCAISGGAVSTVTVVDQGAGYTSAPTITFVNDYRELLNAGPTAVTAGFGASAVCTLTGSGTITGLICVDHGTPLTSVPTLSFSGGGGSSAAATAIMCWTITGVTVSAGGTGFTGPSDLWGLDAFPTAAAAYTNVTTQKNLVKIRRANILLPESAGAITATGLVIYDGGIYTSTPTPIIATNGALITATGTVTFTMGGVSDVSELLVV
jgi:hypothetical protein